MSKDQLDAALGIMRRVRSGNRCVVSHPDAGGQCEREAAMTVWTLSFCELHGREAELSAVEEFVEDVETELEVLIDAEKARPQPNLALVRALEWAEVPGRGGGAVEHHTEALRVAYPPVEGRIHPDTLIYDYGDPTGDELRDGDGPHDWWNEAHWVATRAMRMAHDRGLAGLLKDLEYVRERAAAQIVQAEEDLKRRWLFPRLAAKGGA